MSVQVELTTQASQEVQQRVDQYWQIRGIMEMQSLAMQRQVIPRPVAVVDPQHREGWNWVDVVSADNYPLTKRFDGTKPQKIEEDEAERILAAPQDYVFFASGLAVRVANPGFYRHSIEWDAYQQIAPRLLDAQKQRTLKGTLFAETPDCQEWTDRLAETLQRHRPDQHTPSQSFARGTISPFAAMSIHVPVTRDVAIDYDIHTYPEGIQTDPEDTGKFVDGDSWISPAEFRTVGRASVTIREEKRYPVKCAVSVSDIQLGIVGEGKQPTDFLVRPHPNLSTLSPNTIEDFGLWHLIPGVIYLSSPLPIARANAYVVHRATETLEQAIR